MSDILFVCPVPTVIPAIALPTCPAKYGNICGIGFQLKQASASFDVDTIKLLATWTPLIASATSTGLRPVAVANFETTPGEAITKGGNDQTTTLGREALKYGGFTKATGMLEEVDAAYAKKIRGLTQFSAVSKPTLRAYLLTDEDYVISNPDFQGVPIWSFFVGDVKKGGDYKVGDNYNIQFGMDYGWSHNTVSTHVDFDIRSILGLS